MNTLAEPWHREAEARNCDVNDQYSRDQDAASVADVLDDMDGRDIERVGRLLLIAVAEGPRMPKEAGDALMTAAVDEARATYARARKALA